MNKAALAFATALLTGTTACSTAAAGARSATTGHTAAGTTASRQLAWVTSVSRHLPVSDAAAKAHFAPAALTALGGAAGLTKVLARIGPLAVQQALKASPDRAADWFTGAHGTALFGTVSTNAAGLIAGLYFAAEPGSWSELDATLHRFAPDVSFATSEVDADGRCHVVHGVNADTARPLGSAFKLYVLGALGDAVAAGKVSWSTPLAIREDWKSLPSGILQTKPAGTTLTLAQFADYMISISDNTAADHLIHTLGRGAVEAELSKLGNTHQLGDHPFLTTRELFALKGAGFPTGADQYLALPVAERAAALPAEDKVPLSSISVWQQPRDIRSLEWFAAPTDICSALSGLQQRNAKPGQSGIGAALSINDGGIGLSPKTYPTVWFKGGSEPGVITLNYLARTSHGRTVVTSVMMSNPTKEFPATVVLDALAIARAGIQLAGG